MNLNIRHQGRGGYIEHGRHRFEIEMMAEVPLFSIYFPKKSMDKSIISAKIEIESLIQSDPGKWELVEYDSEHGFYKSMTVNERLFISGLIDDFDNAIQQNDLAMMRSILAEVELSDDNIEAVLADV